MNRRWTFAIGGVAIVTTAVVARHLLGERFEPGAILTLLRGARDSAWAVPAYLAIYFASTAMLMPAIAMHVAAGAVWGFGQGWLLAFLGANLASNAQFAIGRWVGPQRVKAWLLQRGLTGLVEELEQRGALTIMIVRQLPLPFVGVNVGAGASPVTWPQFVVGNAVGLLPSITIYTYFAATLADGVEGARTEALIRAVIAAVAAVGIGLFSRWLSRRRRAAGSQPTTPT